MKQYETDKILNSLDGLQKADPGPFFYTRVQARLHKEEEAGFWAGLASFLARPSVALLTLLAICLLNVAAFLYQRHASSVDQGDQVLTESYNTTLAANSYYDENTDPR